VPAQARPPISSRAFVFSIAHLVPLCKFNHHRLSRIGFEPRRRKVQQRAIIELNGTGRNHVSKAHINLQGDAGVPEARETPHADALVGQLLADRLCADGFRIERQAVAFHALSADLGKDLLYAGDGGLLAAG
jgi:hypothetical protein